MFYCILDARQINFIDRLQIQYKPISIDTTDYRHRGVAEILDQLCRPVVF